jgi:two-component system, cell cycle response regulator
MRIKILTVDDSKTVRIIVRKAFKAYDCEILEAANGVEGLALAAKTMPDLILLDVTMPVMDGVEMLTKLKSDLQLKGIPVMMLTAEGGRDNVLKIAKIGVRDYIVKPFEEDVLIEKAGRIIELTQLQEGPAKVRTLADPATILCVDDKPAIIQQIQTGLKHTPWKVVSAANQSEAIDYCSKMTPDVVIVSLSLPEEAAFALYRHIRSHAKMKMVPVFGLVVKTEAAMQQHAQTAGLLVVTKPIDCVDLEARIVKSLHLDTSGRYFGSEDGYFTLKMPENCSPAALAEIATSLKPKLTEAVDAGQSRALINLSAMTSLHMGAIKQIVQAMQLCHDTGLNYALIGNPQLLDQCKGFEDTRSWQFFHSVEDAKTNFGKTPSMATV